MKSTGSHLISDTPRCSHGALSPCCMGQDAPAERGGYRADVYKMPSKNFLALAGCLLLALGGTASATTLLDTTTALTVSDPTQLGRLTRNGIPQDSVHTEAFPGVFNPTITYHYRTFTIPAASLTAGRYVQVLLDDCGNQSIYLCLCNLLSAGFSGHQLAGRHRLVGKLLRNRPGFFTGAGSCQH